GERADLFAFVWLMSGYWLNEEILDRVDAPEKGRTKNTVALDMSFDHQGKNKDTIRAKYTIDSATWLPVRVDMPGDRQSIPCDFSGPRLAAVFAIPRSVTVQERRPIEIDVEGVGPVDLASTSAFRFRKCPPRKASFNKKISSNVKIESLKRGC